MGVSGFLGKLFGGEPAKNEAVRGETLLRAYGKLPFYAEYRRLEVAPGGATAFTQWMDAGRLAWARSPTHRDDGVIRSTRLMLRLPGSRELVVACVWDSRDSLGRLFPFTFFVVCPPEALGANLIEQWCSACAVHTTLDLANQELRALSGGGDFYRHFQKRALQLRPADIAERVESLRDAAAKIEFTPWYKGWRGDGEDDGTAWLGAVLARGRQIQDASDALAESAISVPLASIIPHSAQAALWLDWLAAPLEKLGRTPTVMLAVADSSHAMLHIAAREVLPDDFQLLTTDDARYGYVERLGAVNGAAAATPSSPFLLASLRSAVTNA